MPAIELGSSSQLETLPGSIVICDFWANWCQPCQQMNTIFDKLAEAYPAFSFIKIDAEKLTDITEKFEITAVPSFLFLRNGTVFDKIEGASPAELATKVEKYSKVKGGETTQTTQESTTEAKIDIKTRLEKLINYAPAMLFMKGTPTAPQCGFSSKIVEILNQEKAEFSFFNILTDEEVRTGLKAYSNWPTFPQLYVNGKLIGGLDIVKEMQEEGQLGDLFPKKQDKNSHLLKLVSSSPVMLFMKGSPDAPKCGFSSKIVDILRKEGIQFGSFDILTDEEVRQGLKTYSNWPTYPQLYSKGKLIGGLDIVKELSEQGDLLSSLN